MRFWNRRLRFFALFGLALVVVFGLVYTAARTWAAGQFTYAIDLTYRLNNTGTTTVFSQYKVTNNTDNRVLASLTINAPTDQVDNLRVTTTDGRSVQAKVQDKTNTSLGYSYQYKEITLIFPDWPNGRGMTQAFNVTYDTAELVDVKGSSKTLYVPSLAQIGEDENYTVSVSAPPGFGKLISTGAMPEINGTDGNNIRYTFMKSSDLKRSVSLIFGDTTVYTADFAYPLHNKTNREQIYTITLPPDTSSQKIFIRKLDPEPVATRLDADGNVLADYKLTAGQQITVHTDVAAQIKYLEYDLDKSGEKSDIPVDIGKAYTSGSHYWQTTDPDLQIKANQAAAGKTKVIDIARALNNLTIETLTYNNEKIKYNIRQGSTKALQNPDNAVCLEYSDLMVALLRSQGIPARMPVGYAYAGNLKQSKAVSDSLHSWVEAYVPGIGWMNIDPTWGEKFDSFGQSDLDHFTFAIWGRQDALPAATMQGSTDLNYQYEDTIISYSNDFPQAVVTGQATVKKLAILPGVSLVQYTVQAPENVAGDNYTVELKQGNATRSTSLGSLAPKEAVSRWSVVWGVDYSKPAELTFAQKSNDSLSVLAAGTGVVQYWPMVLTLSLLAGVLLLYAVKLFIRKRRSKTGLKNQALQSYRDKMQQMIATQKTEEIKAAEQAYAGKNNESNPTQPPTPTQ